MNTGTETLAARMFHMELEKAASLYVQGAPITKIAELCPPGVEKTAFIAAAARLIPGALRLGGKLLGGGGRAAGKVVGGAGRLAAKPITAPAGAMGRGMLGYAKRKPLQAAMLGMTAMEGVSSGRKAYRGYSAATQGGRFGAQARQYMNKMKRIDPTPQYAQISGF